MCIEEFVLDEGGIGRELEGLLSVEEPINLGVLEANEREEPDPEE